MAMLNLKLLILLRGEGQKYEAEDGVTTSKAPYWGRQKCKNQTFRHLKW